MPSGTLTRATLEDQDVLFRLAQFYQYDFSEYLPGDVDADGHFPFIRVNTYLNKGHQAYLARVDGHLAGFVLLDETPPHRGGDGRYVAEFFVMRRFRRKGIGRGLAFQTFDTFKGYWEIAEVGPNLPAQAFWRAVIGEYSKGRYEEIITQEEGLKIVWQMFDSRDW